MKKRLNKKAFTLIEIVIAVGILAAASIGIGAIVVGVQNNSQKQFSQGDLQKQLADVQDSLKNDLLTTNAGVKYWIQDDTSAYLTSDGANKNPDRSKIVAMYAMDYIDNTLTKTYVKYDAQEDILYKAEKSETVVFDNSKKMLLDESPDEVLADTSLEWYVYAQGITNFSMDLSKYSENSTINYNVNINSESSNYKSDNTVNIRNEIPINKATILENYDQAVVTRPSLKNKEFTYNGTVQSPKQLDVNSRYMEIRIEDSTKDKTEARDVGEYRIIYHLKNATWDDGTTDDHIEYWSIVPRNLEIVWDNPPSWPYDGLTHTIGYTVRGLVPGDYQESVLALHNGTVGPDYGTQTASLQILNPNYTILENQEIEIAITKGAAYYTVQPMPAGSADSPLVYNGQAQALVTPGSSPCGEIYYSLSANTGFSTELPKATSANNENPYIVYYYIKGAGSFSDSEIQYMQVVMQRATPKIDKPIPFDGVTNKTHYTGSTQSLLYYAGATSASEGNTNHMVYSVDGNTYSSSLPLGIAAQQYTVWYKSEQTENFKATEPQYVMSTILKTERPSDSYKIPQVNSLIYNGTPQPLFTAGTGSATQSTGWMYKLDDTEWMSEIPEREPADTYKVYLKIPETSDYAEFVLPEPIEVTIEKADAKFEKAPSALNNLIYNGDLQTLISIGTTRDGTVYYKLSLGEDKPSKEEMTTATPKVTAAGTYIVYYYIKGDENHNDSEIQYLTARLAAATPGVQIAPLPATIYYNGNHQLLLASQGLSDNGSPLHYSLTNTPDSWGENVPTGFSAGTYTVYYKVPADDNHSESIVYSVIATIKQAETVIVAPVPFDNLVYNGSLQQLCQAGDSEFGTMEYSLDKENWTTEPPREIDAKTYSIYWRVQGTSDYRGADGKITVTVNKQTLNYTPPIARELYYNNDVQELVEIPTGALPDGYKFQFKFEDDITDWSDDLPTGVDAGTYDIQYRIVSNNIAGDNIGAEDSRMSVTILPASPTVNIAPAADLVYNGQNQYLLDENLYVEYGQLEYATSLSGPYSTTLPLGKNADSYVIYWRTVYSENLVRQQGAVTANIARLQIPYPRIEGVSSFLYDGSLQYPDLVYDENHVSITSGIFPEKAVGNYEIDFELNDINNVEWIDGENDIYSLSWTITKGETLPFVAPVAIENKYDGYEKMLFTPGEVDTQEGTFYYRIVAKKRLDDDKYTMVSEEESPWTHLPLYETDIGYYKVAYKVISPNYADYECEEPIVCMIDKGNMTVTFGFTGAPYNGQQQRPEVTLEWLGAQDNITDDDEKFFDEHGNIVSIVQKRAIIEISTDNGKTWKKYVSPFDDATYDPTQYYLGETSVGEYSLQYRITDPLGQYNTFSQSVFFTIGPGTPSWQGLPEAKTVTYTGSAQSLVTEPEGSTYEGMHFEYQVAPAYYDESGNLVIGTYSAMSKTATQTNAGFYAIKIWGIADAHYELQAEHDDGSTTPIDKLELDIIYASIEKAEVTITTFPTVNSSVLYDTGDSQHLGLVGGTLTNSGNAYFVYQIWYYESPSSEPTLYTVNIGSDKKNKGSDGTNIFYIAKDITTSKPTIKNVGTYKILWWVKGDDNYADYFHGDNDMLQMALSVDIVPNSKDTVAGRNTPYTGKPQQIFTVPTKISNSVVFVSSDGTTWTKDSAEIKSLTTKTAVGEYSLYWKLGESGETQGPVSAKIETGTLYAQFLTDFIKEHKPINVIFSNRHDVTSFAGTIYDMSYEQNRSVVAWLEGDHMFIASSAPGGLIKAPANCASLFENCDSIISVDVTGLDTSATTNMSKMFKGLGKNKTDADVQILGLESLNTQNVTNASQMFMEAGLNANTVYAPYAQRLTFATGANTTDWLKDFGANTTQTETYSLRRNVVDIIDTTASVMYDNNHLLLTAPSELSENVEHSVWTAKYNRETIDVDIYDAYSQIEYYGPGSYTINRTTHLTDGNIVVLLIDINAKSTTEVNVQSVTRINISQDDLTLYALTWENEPVQSAQWSATYQGNTITATEIDALTVSVPNKGAGEYNFTAKITLTTGESIDAYTTFTLENNN